MRAALLALVLVAGCRESRALRWEIALGDPAARARTASVVAEVRRGSCADFGEVAYSAEFDPSEGGPSVPTLGGGPHAFAARARDSACVEFAAGCVDAVLPTDPNRTLTTTLAPIAEGPPACAACRAGACGEADAGP